MTHDDIQAWLDRYVAAWRSNDASQIGELFADDALYRYHPYGDDAVRGREAIVESWLAERDAPESWQAEYVPFAVDGDRAVATGWSRYVATGDEPERTYHNVFLMRFDDDGRCAEFTELFMLEKVSK
ncbi:MAG: nuclear transport factor 2 family protein [Chloroflexota bacterium]|nr:nuclear transport factor 2 family protein [Chloroflexota bacterium]